MTNACPGCRSWWSFAGVTSAQPADNPHIMFNKPIVTGKLDRTMVAAVVQRSEAQLLDCYKSTLKDPAVTSGSATTRFTIEADGKVTRS